MLCDTVTLLTLHCVTLCHKADTVVSCHVMRSWVKETEAVCRVVERDVLLCHVVSRGRG